MFTMNASKTATQPATLRASRQMPTHRACRPVSALSKRTSGAVTPLASTPRGLRSSLSLKPTGVAIAARAPTRAGGRAGRLAVTAAIGNVTETNNPALKYGNFSDSPIAPSFGGERELMTVEGVVDKSALLLGIMTTSAAYSWWQIYSGLVTMATVMATIKGAGIASIVLVLATCFKPHWSPKTVPLYAVAKGLALGGTSAILELAYPGVVIQSLCLTFGTLGALLFSYRSGLIEVGDQFKSMVYTATGGFFIGILGMMLLRMCGVAVPVMYSGPMAIGISAVSVALASFNLLVDFSEIEAMSYRSAMPKWMEWYSGFSLLVTLVWMYTSILRLLVALRGRN